MACNGCLDATSDSGEINLMLNDKKIGFIGSGNMGEALINGLISSGSAPVENIICSDVREDRLEYIT